MDVAGEQQIDVVSNLLKTRRRLDGSKIGVELDDTHMRRKMAGKCGPCFPNHDEMQEVKDQCCNSCADVQSVYRRKGLRRLNWEEHPMCRHEAMLADPVSILARLLRVTRK